MALVLASSSDIRSELLRRCGVDVRVVPARVDEAAVREAMAADAAPPRDVADVLAELKAQSVARRYPDDLVLGADQILVAGARVFDKPRDLENARGQLRELRGKRHSLYAAAVIVEAGRPVWRHIGRADLEMREFSDDFLERYLGRHGDDLLATVGCYKIEQDGACLFSRITGDYFSILGLPLLEVLGFLQSRGIATA